MRVLVIGSGGREHAIVWKISQSKALTALYCAPGNPGIASHARCLSLKATDHKSLLEFAKAERIDLTVVGPEQPLAEGIADLFESDGLTIFGPTRLASQLEWSKAFAKEFMMRHSIPTALYRTFGVDDVSSIRDYVTRSPKPLVLKVDGLAAGKGVMICSTVDQALSSVNDIVQKRAFGPAGNKIVVEEFLEGREASVFAVCDGVDYLTLASAQDYKRAFDHDRGKNTGGMGSYAPATLIDARILDAIRRQIIEPALQGMAKGGMPYKGCLYVGVMITKEGPKVVEFNSRFGDPETQVVLPIFKGDFLEMLLAASTKNLASWKRRAHFEVAAGAAVCVILASKGYPDVYETGKDIHGLDESAGRENLMVFHAGTTMIGNTVRTAGGRVLGVTSHEPNGSLIGAVESAYAAVRHISFDGMHFRKDIGRSAPLHELKVS